MSVQAFLDHQKAVEKLARESPGCWVLVANPVTANFEHQLIVAAFDTREEAEAYVDASLVNGPRQQIGGYWRSFKAESLLFGFNNEAGNGSRSDESRHPIVFHLTNPRVSLVGNGWDTNTAAINPPPPVAP